MTSFTKDSSGASPRKIRPQKALFITAALVALAGCNSSTEQVYLLRTSDAPGVADVYVATFDSEEALGLPKREARPYNEGTCNAVRDAMQAQPMIQKRGVTFYCRKGGK